MGEWNRGQVSIKRADGAEINDFLSFTLSDRYTDPLGNYQFTVQPAREQVREFNRNVNKGDLVGVTINNHPQGAFLIVDKLHKINKQTGSIFELTCKTVLTTPNEGSVDPDIAESFQSDTPVSEVILTAMAPYGFDTIVTDASADVRALTGKPLDGRKPTIAVSEIKHKEAKAQEGDAAYGFCARIFSRLGLAMRVNFEGTLLLGSPDYEQDALYQVSQSSSLQGDQMMGDISIRDTNAGQFSEVVIRGSEKDEKGQKRAGRPTHRLRVSGLADPPVEPAFTDEPTTTIERGRHSYRSDSGAPFKPSYRADKLARDKDFAEQRCHRWLGRRSESGFVVECTVDGLVASTGAIWTVDTICRVVIEQADIDDDMWILATEKSMNKEDGQTTKLTLIPKNSLQLGVS